MCDEERIMEGGQSRERGLVNILRPDQEQNMNLLDKRTETNVDYDHSNNQNLCNSTRDTNVNKQDGYFSKYSKGKQTDNKGSYIYASGQLDDLELDTISVAKSIQDLNKEVKNESSPKLTRGQWLVMLAGTVFRAYRVSLMIAFGVYYVQFIWYFDVSPAAASWMRIVEQAFALTVGKNILSFTI